MATEPDVTFIRNNFEATVPADPEHDLEDCNCVQNCCLKFPLESRLLLRAGYQRLTPEGRTAFLAAHTPSSEQTQYMLPTAETGLEKVCAAFFMNALQESRARVRQELLGKRKAGQPEVEFVELDESSEEILPDKRCKRDNERMVFDVDEDLEKDIEDNGFRGFPMDIDCVKVEDFKPEMNGTEQLILPDGHAAINGEVIKVNGDKIVSDCDEGSNTCNDPVKHEPIDIETEMNDQEADNCEFVVVLPRDDIVSEEDELLLDPEVYDADSGSRFSSSNIQKGVSRRTIALNFIRECKIRGLSYTNDCGRIVPARAVKPSCGTACKIQCRTRVSEEVRQQLLTNLLQMSLSDQWKYINDHICNIPAAKSRSQSGRRKLSRHYFLPVESRLVKVCKTMFAKTFDLSNKVLRRISANKIGDKHVVCGNPNFPALLKRGSKFYFDYDGGCDQAARIPQQGRCKCNLQCGNMISEGMIKQIRSRYREKSKKEQEDFLFKHVQLTPGKRERYKSLFIRARFFLPLESTVKEVCRQMFLSTFKLKSSQLNTLMKNLPKNPNILVEAMDSFETGINDAHTLEGECLDDKILPDNDEASHPDDPVKHEPVDIETKTNKLETVHHDEDSIAEDFFPDPDADDEEGDDHLGTDKLGRRRHTIRGQNAQQTRTLQPNCGATCQFQCRTRVSDELRQQLFANLLQKSQNEQRKFIADHICGMPSLRYPLTGRQFNHYFLPIESRLVKVCKTMFANTYDLNPKMISGCVVKKGTEKHVVCGNPNFPALMLNKGSNYYFDYDESCEQALAVSHQVRQEGCKCDLQCGSMFSEEVIAQIRNSFLEKSKEEQNEFLSRHVQLLTDKRRRQKSAIFRARFFLPLGSTVKKVCRKMFLYTFKLTTSQLKRLRNNLPGNPDMPVAAEDSVEFAEVGMDLVPCPNVLDGNGNEDKILPEEVSNSLNDPVEHDPVDIKTEINEVEEEHRDDDSIDEELLHDPEAADEEQGDNSTTDSQSEVVPLEDDEELFCKRRRKLRGLSYTSSGGQLIPGRAVKPNCGSTCQFQCRTRVSEEVRQQLFANLLQKSKTGQRKFIADHICSMPTNRHRLTGRLYNHYFLPVESKLVKVCKTMFVNTYDITDKIIRGILAKKGTDKHMVCGNPNFPALMLNKCGKLHFDYDEGYDLSQEVCKCQLQCESKFSEEVIEQIQDNFREMSKKRQDKFLSKHVQLFNDKRSQNKNPLNRARYFLPRVSTRLEEVCRSMFQHAFQLHTSQVRDLVINLPLQPDPLELAREHITAHRMEEDHHCAVNGGLRKLSHSPNVARMYSEYREEGSRQRGVEPIDYRQYFDEFCRHFAKTGLLRPTSCPDCGYFDRGEGG